MSQTPLADQIAIISRDEFQRYIEQFRPTEQALIDSLNKSTVQPSMDAAQKDAVRARETLDRMRDRYGVGATADQASVEARHNSLSGALGTLNAGNVARRADEDNKRQTLSTLMNIGQTIRQQALGNYNSAASLEGARASANNSNQIAYQQQKAANRAQTTQAAASLAATAAMMFF